VEIRPVQTLKIPLRDDIGKVEENIAQTDLSKRRNMWHNILISIPVNKT
jgi:hypothetical protein